MQSIEVPLNMSTEPPFYVRLVMGSSFDFFDWEGEYDGKTSYITQPGFHNTAKKNRSGFAPVLLLWA